MANKKFSASEWNKIMNLAQASAEDFGLPRRRSKSVVLGTFNIRKLGRVKGGPHSPRAWDFLEIICKRFDLLAIQEVMDDLGGITELKERLGNSFGMVVSDVTGVFPGVRGNAERLGFLFNWKRVPRTELASDITYDRSKVVDTLYQNRDVFSKTWKKHSRALKKWENDGKKPKEKPKISLPMFLTFIRQPHCTSFRINGENGAKPIEFLAVNAHLLYGENEYERLWEFNALIEWLTIRAKKRDKLYHENILMMGDCNLEFENIQIKRDTINDDLKRINKTKLKSKKAAKVNFPLLDKHPDHGELKTNARQDQTYDQIAIFAHDTRLPTYKDNEKAGQKGPDGYDYGVFKFTDLFAEALFGKKKFDDLLKKEKTYIFDRTENDISDHMPAWIRLSIPGA